MSTDISILLHCCYLSKANITLFNCLRFFRRENSYEFTEEFECLDRSLEYRQRHLRIFTQEFQIYPMIYDCILEVCPTRQIAFEYSILLEFLASGLTIFCDFVNFCESKVLFYAKKLLGFQLFKKINFFTNNLYIIC